MLKVVFARDAEDCFRPTLFCDACGGRVDDLLDANLLWDAEMAMTHGAGLAVVVHKGCSQDPRYASWHWCGAEAALEQLANNANPEWPARQYEMRRTKPK